MKTQTASSPVTPASANEPKPQRTEEEFQKIVLEQMPQVKYIARRIHEHLPQHVPFEDLVHAGIVGLIDALNKFDSDKNVKFSSYAKFRIRGAILDSLREMDWSPRDLRRKSRQIDSVMQKLQAELGRTASEGELAKAMGLSLQELHHLVNEIRGLEIGSLHAESNTDGQETDLEQNLAGPPDQDPLTLCLSGERKERLEKAIARLPEREQQVLMLYYQQELTMREVGELMGVGESRVSQIHTLAVKHLRTVMSVAAH
ncbi:MAG TPA: FliA/WhiG family RNA polymerase sigma factor [Candidatus Eisenbacteria bacterium]|nr:FliA/WhiG family RNA polymerase sigma factor [Candidatus Eisenbacteria bacterium]